MFGRTDADFRAHRNRRKSRLGKLNADVDRPIIPFPSQVFPRRTLGSRMSQVLYQEAVLNRKKEAAKANPKKCLFSESGYEKKTDYYSFKAQKTAPYSTQYGFSSVEDHDVTGVYPMDDESKTRILGVRNTEPQQTSGPRLPLKDHNFRFTSTKPVDQLFKNYSTSTAITDSTKKCLSKQLAPWNVVQSPVLPKLSGFPNTKTPRAQKFHNIESPVMPRLSSFPHSIKSAVKINVIPPEKSEDNPKSEDISYKKGSLKLKYSDMPNFNYPVIGGQKESRSDVSEMLNFKYPITDVPKDSSSGSSEVVPNFRYPITGDLNDCGRDQTKLSNFNYDVKGGSNSGNDVSKSSNFNYPVKGGSNSGNDVSKLSNFDYPVSERSNECGLDLTKPSNLRNPVPKQGLYSETDEYRDSNNKEVKLTFNNEKSLVVDQKMKRMIERQRKMSVSEMEFEKICEMRSEGSQSLLSEFCLNGKSDSEKNDSGNTKENVLPKEVTNYGERLSVSSIIENANGTIRSVPSNIVNGNGTRRSISSNVNGNGTRRSISSNVNGNGTRRSISNNTVNENGVQYSKLKQPQYYASKVENNLQPEFNRNKNHQNNYRESPKFVIRKRKDSFISSETFSEDSFNKYDTILNNCYESSTLIVNNSNVDASLKDVDDIDETLSNIELNDVGKTFLVQSNVPRKLFLNGTLCEDDGVVSENVNDETRVVEDVGNTFVVQRNMFDEKCCNENGASNDNIQNVDRHRNFGDTFVIPKNTSQKVLLDDEKFCQENKASILKAPSTNEEINVDLGVDMLNESLNTTLRFVQNETLCQNETNDEHEVTLLESGVKNGGKFDVNRNGGEETNARRNLEEEMNAKRNLEQEMDVNRMGEGRIDVKNTEGEKTIVNNMETVEDNIQTIPQNCQNTAAYLEVMNNEVSENGQHHENFMKNLMERHKFLVHKSGDLFNSRKQIISQIKVLEETLVEQEEQFKEINSEFCNLFREFSEVLAKQQKGNGTLTVFDKKNDGNVSGEIDNNVSNNVKVSESVIVPFSVCKNVLDTPRSARRVRRNLVFSQLKSDFSCLKTPLPSTAKKLQESTANKTILTPKSMTVCIQDQVNQLFDS